MSARFSPNEGEDNCSRTYRRPKFQILELAEIYAYNSSRLAKIDSCFGRAGDNLDVHGWPIYVIYHDDTG